MTDISIGTARKSGLQAQAPEAASAISAGREPGEKERLVAFVELLFFAYRDFTGEADAILVNLGLGRAHHRVLHFINRHPGLRVADLLDILKITKQSLARVLKELVAKDYVVQRSGKADRRERLLFVTAKGARLADELLSLQSARIAKALAETGPESAAIARMFLTRMIAEPERRRVERLIFNPGFGADKLKEGP